MKACVQRVLSASVAVGGEVVGEISEGLLVFLGVEKGDEEKDLAWIGDKILNLRIFRNNDKHFDKSLADTGASVLIISQFTLAGSCEKGRRPDFAGAMQGEQAEDFYNKFITLLKNALGQEKTACGIFGADMQVSLINDGPATFIIETKVK